MNYRKYRRIGLVLLSVYLIIGSLLFPFIPVNAAKAAKNTIPDVVLEAEARKSLPVETNQIENWPNGPAIGAETAILMDADTGIILYAKNIHKKMYPASTTKLMTCLLAAEKSKMDETVTFSHNAVFSVEVGGSNIGIDEGQAMPMEECLYGILVASANEVANAVAEHISGSVESFCDLMNKRAAELGCTNTHFTNPHGLYNEDHYTSAYDLALIAKAFFQNELLSKIGDTPKYHFEATATQPDDFIERNKHKLITGEIACEGIKGGKTGYTDEARQTLVTCAEKNGMKLICVILKEESPEQFHDTVKLFDYGFSNFSAVNVSETETRYTVNNPDFFQTTKDVFGNSEPILSINPRNYLIIPKTVRFEDLDSEITYDVEDTNEVARINYYYHNTKVGTASIELAAQDRSAYSFDTQVTDDEKTSAPDHKVIFINIKIVLFSILGVAALLIVAFLARAVIANYAFINNSKGRRRRRKNRRNNPRFPYNDHNRY